jgi:hypothetical protein
VEPVVKAIDRNRTLTGVQQIFFMKVFSPLRGWGVGFALIPRLRELHRGLLRYSHSVAWVLLAVVRIEDQRSKNFCVNLWLNNGTTEISPASK